MYSHYSRSLFDRTCVGRDLEKRRRCNGENEERSFEGGLMTRYSHFGEIKSLSTDVGLVSQVIRPIWSS